ncbi:MAG: DivIVA domain-containing protein [Ignavibacterium sp.]
MFMSLKSLLKNYFAAFMIAVFIYTSNFLNTDLFNFGEFNFVVWFVLSIFCFASGWFINRQIGWHNGGKVLFAIIVAITILSLITVTFFSEYFGTNQIITENLILFSLRNITLGAMGFFGMAVQEVLSGEREAVILREKLKIYEDNIIDAKKEAELTLKEAEIKAKEILSDAEAQAKNTILKKERIERELKEFIQAEKELIKKYKDL